MEASADDGLRVHHVSVDGVHRPDVLIHFHGAVRLGRVHVADEPEQVAPIVVVQAADRPTVGRREEHRLRTAEEVSGDDAAVGHRSGVVRRAGTRGDALGPEPVGQGDGFGSRPDATTRLSSTTGDAHRDQGRTGGQPEQSSTGQDVSGSFLNRGHPVILGRLLAQSRDLVVERSTRFRRLRSVVVPAALLVSEPRRADDSRPVLEGGRNDRGPELQLGQEQLRLLGDATADDEQVG